MDDVLGRMGDRFITDSTMMWIMHCAMDRAHERVHSKEGAIARLNEISKFYELAVMQLEGCLKFVQEEADNDFESSDEEAIGDLTDIRDRLLGRLEESELAISEKDRELVERLENEVKLRQALEVKERELVSLCANLELKRTENEDMKESPDELRNSVGQQLWNVNQDLEPHSLKIKELSSDIDTLKETMDIAFGRMQSTILLTQLGPIEQQWRWKIEKDVIAILVRGFTGNIWENFEEEVMRQEKKVSIGLSNHLSDLMNEITSLHEELEPLNTFQSDLECRITLEAKGRSSSVGDTYLNLGDSIRGAGTLDPRRQIGDEDPEDDGDNYVAKMIKSHESIIRRKSEELHRQKREIPRGKGSSYSRTEMDPISPRQRIHDVIAKMESLINWNAKLGKGVEDVKRTNSRKKTCTLEKTEHDQSHIDTLEDVWEKVNKISISHAENEEQHNEIKTQEKEETDLLIRIMEETYITLLEGLVNESCTELYVHDLEILISEGMYEHILMEIDSQWKQKLQCHNIESQIGEEIYYLVLKESPKEVTSGLASALVECQHTTAQSNCLNDKNLEGKVREEVFGVIFQKRFEECNAVIEGNDSRRPVNLNKSGEVEPQDHCRVPEYCIPGDNVPAEGGRRSTLRDFVKVEEGLLQSSRPDTNENNAPCPDITGMSHKELDKLKNSQKLLVEEIKGGFVSVSGEVEKALQKLAVSKTQLRELTSSVGIEDNKEVKIAPSDFASISIMGFFQELVDFKFRIEEKLGLNNLRLENAMHRLNPLVEQVASLKRKEWVYRQGFISRCQSLQKAEAEVDLLGDQVDVLLLLLEKIYGILHQHSPVLQQYFEVSDILTMTKIELVRSSCFLHFKVKAEYQTNKDSWYRCDSSKINK